ncbi:hypothetical protein D0469_20785 [Peribacillus saganii]|uniref:Cthe-2314-like HEPN domain-containing protein n=1 Tax=Peribacillus saganii TaxID=2303992 RepID=A0A372L8V0_9BACI|nr:Cthe_2314 family HEPN domain-containing protein [Peribacillus saganii]RFU61959.1 hypothetical protein D0469_20785 [Peribacillus saganii]
MATFLDYADYPTKESWNEQYRKKEDTLNKIRLKEKGGTQTYSVLSSEGLMNLELSFWIGEFNNKANDLINNYIILMHHYDKGIPDTEWFTPREKGGVQFFPHFEEKHHHIIYWFGFYTDSYYTRFASLIDTIYHIINVKYYLGIEAKIGFRGQVAKALKSEDEALFNYLDGIRENHVYKEVEYFRNDITHNFRPNQISSGIKRKKGKGFLSISGGIGEYTTTTAFVANIEKSLNLIAEILDEIREKLESGNKN